MTDQDVFGLARLARRAYLTADVDLLPRTWPMTAWFDEARGPQGTIVMTTYLRGAKVAYLQRARGGHVLLAADEPDRDDARFASATGTLAVRRASADDLARLEVLRAEQPDARARAAGMAERAELLTARLRDGRRVLVELTVTRWRTGRRDAPWPG